MGEPAIPTRAAPIVVLNGAPRSGKTRIVRALDALDGERAWTNLGVETSRAATPAGLQPGIGLRPGGERPDVEAALPGLLADLYDGVAARSRQGHAVVVDVGHHEGHSRPLDEVVRRRRASGPGYAALGADGEVAPEVRRGQDEVHRPGPYDLEVDTAVLTPDEAAARILRLVADGRPTALARQMAGAT